MILTNIMSDCNFWPTSVELMLHKIASVENQISSQLFIQNQESTSLPKGKYFSTRNMNYFLCIKKSIAREFVIAKRETLESGENKKILFSESR